jgi:hypothetical protein
MAARSLLVLLLASLAPTPAAAQARLTGDIHVDPGSGRIAADVCVSGLPLQGDTAVFALNRGFDIDRMAAGADPPRPLEMEPGGAAVRYRVTGVPADGRGFDGRPTGSACVAYSGAHRVFDLAGGDFRHDDEASVIAFGGGTVRARGASRWYPAPHDPVTGLTREELAFEIRVACGACATIYVNGGVASGGGVHTFASAEPREIFLLAGDLPVVRAEESLILGEVDSPATASAFLGSLGRIQEFYADYLALPFGRAPDVVLFTPVRQPKKGLLWGFFSDPALALSGMTLDEFVQALSPGSASRTAVFGFLAHELAHRYFGWGLGTESPQRDLFGEPFATVLELKAIRHFFGEERHASAVRSLVERARDGPELPPLDRAGADDFAVDAYRYAYAPLLLLSLEAAIGEHRFVEILRRLTLASAEARQSADYRFLRQLGLESGVDEAEWERWERGCLRQRLPETDCLPAPGGR